MRRSLCSSGVLAWLAALAEQSQTLHLPLDDDALLTFAGEDTLHASAEFIELCESQLELLPCLVEAPAGLRASVCGPLPGLCSPQC